MLYMGKDKYENEDLIKYGWPEDVWFHVDNLSSAHVYARLPPGSTMDDMSEDLIRDCAQLVKANSIEGCKKPSVVVIYTPWGNLKKDGGMEAGQVSFFNEKLVRKHVVLEKDKETLKRLGKTKDEKHPNLAEERQQRDNEERSALKAAARDKSKAEKQLEEQRKKEKAERSYDRLFNAADGKTEGGASGGAGGVEATEDVTASRAFEDDFM